MPKQDLLERTKERLKRLKNKRGLYELVDYAISMRGRHEKLGNVEKTEAWRSLTKEINEKIKRT